MNKKARKEAMSRLIKEAKEEKVLEDISKDINMANTKDPQEYANKVFDALIENLYIPELDD